MKSERLHPLHLFPVFLLLGSILFATDIPAIWPMPSSLPSSPADANPAAFPLPRLEWIERVNSNNKNAAQTAAGIQLVFDGDSITDFWQKAGAQIWKERYANLGAFDFGISGDRTEHLLWRLSQDQMEGIQPRLIVLLIGTNNIDHNSVEQIAGGVKAIVDEYRKRCPGATILLQGIFPHGRETTDPRRAKIKAVNKIIAGLADGNHVLFVDFGDRFLQPDGTLRPDIMPDYLHPGPKGYQIWADAIQPVVDRLFPPGS